ncbi:MAG: putative collagen-binding domain-containing protein, partial [Petrimonas sp.]|nr:putative collagen-binding domain-containing protein [Petrimonas sp.]
PWEIIAEGLKAQPRRPIIDLEPCYEDHPVNPWDNKWTRAERGYFDDYDVRARMYRGVFAGGAGATYGHHHTGQFLDTLRNPPIWVGDTIIGWKKALTAKAANQIHHLKELMLSHPDFNRVEDNGLVASDQGSDYTDQIIATRNEKATYALVYLPQPKTVKIDLDKLKQGRKKIAWFNPVTGKYSKVKEKFNNGVQSFTPPNPQQKDWVLVVEVK